uniref:Putative secreted protein n=1 Tax=Ixodes ricinus TaxID=34613 RepID=A0A6B0U6C2_IXORI
MCDLVCLNTLVLFCIVLTKVMSQGASSISLVGAVHMHTTLEEAVLLMAAFLLWGRSPGKMSVCKKCTAVYKYCKQCLVLAASTARPTLYVMEKNI